MVTIEVASVATSRSGGTITSIPKETLSEASNDSESCMLLQYQAATGASREDLVASSSQRTRDLREFH